MGSFYYKQGGWCILTIGRRFQESSSVPTNRMGFQMEITPLGIDPILPKNPKLPLKEELRKKNS